MPVNSLGIAEAGSNGASARETRVTDSSRSRSVSADSGFTSSIVVPGNDTSGPPAFVAAYLSPFIRLDSSTSLAILEFRDAETGEVKQQYPSRSAVKQYAQNLPEESQLRSNSDQGAVSFGTGSATGGDSPRIIGSNEDRQREAQDSPTPTPTGAGFGDIGTGGSAGRSAFSAAAAAFGAAANSLVSGLSTRQLAVA